MTTFPTASDILQALACLIFDGVVEKDDPDRTMAPRSYDFLEQQLSTCAFDRYHITQGQPFYEERNAIQFIEVTPEVLSPQSLYLAGRPILVLGFQIEFDFVIKFSHKDSLAHFYCVPIAALFEAANFTQILPVIGSACPSFGFSAPAS